MSCKSERPRGAKQDKSKAAAESLCHPKQSYTLMFDWTAFNFTHIHRDIVLIRFCSVATFISVQSRANFSPRSCPDDGRESQRLSAGFRSGLCGGRSMSQNQSEQFEPDESRHGHLVKMPTPSGEKESVDGTTAHPGRQLTSEHR